MLSRVPVQEESICATDKEGHPDWHKPASVMESGGVSAHGMRRLLMCEGTVNAEASEDFLNKPDFILFGYFTST